MGLPEEACTPQKKDKLIFLHYFWVLISCTHVKISKSIQKTCDGASQVALVVKNPRAYAGDIRCVGSVPGLGRSPGGAHGNLLQYSCREDLMNRRAWWATVHRVSKSLTRLKQLNTHTQTHTHEACDV